MSGTGYAQGFVGAVLASLMNQQITLFDDLMSNTATDTIILASLINQMLVFRTATGGCSHGPVTLVRGFKRKRSLRIEGRSSETLR